MTYEQIMTQLKGGKYAPIYTLCGDEPYFIDNITEQIMKHALEEHERDFNQTVLYGRDTDADTIVETAKRFPMMAERQVVIVKEAQSLRNFDALTEYVKNPSDTTILVLAYKYKKPDGRKEITKLLKKNGVFLETKRLYDDKIPGWVSSYSTEQGYPIEPKAAVLLSEYLGADLRKITNELGKLFLNLGEGTQITPEHIEKYVGVSKEFNNFELQNAIGKRDTLKAMKIVQHFGHNPNANPMVLTLGVLYNFFSKLMLYHRLPSKDRQTVASELGINPYFAKDYSEAARNFKLGKSVECISLLREYDLKSKGVGNSSTPAGELLKELVYKILH